MPVCQRPIYENLDYNYRKNIYFSYFLSETIDLVTLFQA